jgi:glycosyltransferase involved in cell wall biosynthesis
MIERIIQPTKYFVNKASTVWYYNYLRLKIACPVKMPVNESRTISVAIPHYNGSRMAHVSLFNILNDARIAEIVFLDDGSEPEELNKLKTKLKPFSQKVKLFRRDANWGPFANKIQAVELCTSDWVILLDYDNTLLPEYLETIFNLPEWEKSTIYCPGYAYPYFDFRESLGEKDIDLNTTYAMINSGVFDRRFFNDGNYFLHRDSYIQYIKPFWDYSVIADVIFANYLWLSSQNTLKVLRNSRYIHRWHRASTWLVNLQESKRIFNSTEKRLQSKLSPYKECLNNDFNKEPYTWIEPTRMPLR